MGRGSSGIGSGSTVTSVMSQGGKKINLFSTPLVYGLDKNITQAQRKTLEAQEKKRETAVIEHALLVGQDGSVAGAEVSGGSGSCNIPGNWSWKQGAILTHNHPRGAGEDWLIGGTFSTTDLRLFASGKYGAMRASAAEGTYSISKDKGFDANGFASYVRKIASTATRKRNKAVKIAQQDCVNKKITYTDYAKASNKTFNEMLVEVHNGLIAGQQKYGYSYALERRK